jgi:hypothetical protein
MVKAKPKHSKASKPGPKAGPADPGRTGTDAGAAASGKPGGIPFLGNADQIGATVSKGLDLAEAGLSLGLTLINRVGAMVQESIADKLSPAGTAAQAPPAPPPDAAHPGARGPVQEPPSELGAGYCIMNRIPLRPGDEASVSFSINNDSADGVKRVKLQLHGFEGQVSGARIASKDFALTPSSKTIAPMDFEKFVLKGMIPGNVPSDVYHGKVTVVADQAFDIPVRLMIGPSERPPRGASDQ